MTTFANLGVSANPDINSAVDATSYANSSWTPPTSGVIWIFVRSANNAGLHAVAGITGNGLTWEQIATVPHTSNTRRISLWAAKAEGSSPGATTIDFGANTQLCCVASFGHADDLDMAVALAAIFVQAVTATGSANNGSITLAAPGHANNRPISGWSHDSNEAKAHRANWTEADDLSGATPNGNLETQYREDAFETTASATWASTQTFGGIAAELKSAVVPPPPVDPKQSVDSTATLIAAL